MGSKNNSKFQRGHRAQWQKRGVDGRMERGNGITAQNTDTLEGSFWRARTVQKKVFQEKQLARRQKSRHGSSAVNVLILSFHLYLDSDMWSLQIQVKYLLVQNPWWFSQHPDRTCQSTDDTNVQIFLTKMSLWVLCTHILLHSPLQNMPATCIHSKW